MKIYYLFSKSDLSEAIYLCKQGKNIEMPSRKSSVYPMGAIFAKAIQLLSIYDKEKEVVRLISYYETLELGFECFYKTHKKRNEKEIEEFLYPYADIELKESYLKFKKLDKKRHDEFKLKVENELKLKKSMDGTHSFSSVVNNDLVIRMMLEILLKNDKQFLQPIREYSEVISLLKHYFEYIKVCQTNKKIASLDTLEAYSMLRNVELPQRTLYIPTELYKKYNTPEKLKENIEELVSDINKQGDLFDKPVLQHSNILPNLQDITPPSTTTNKLSTPIYVYEINDIIDLILVSLQCIYENNFVLSRCEYCNELFVTHNRSMKYCPNASNRNYCQLKAKGKRRAEEEKDDSCKKLNKIIRTRFYNRIEYLRNKLSNQFKTFPDRYHIQLSYLLDRYDDFKEKCRTNKKDMTDEKYYSWMNSYWNDTLENLPK